VPVSCSLFAAGVDDVDWECMDDEGVDASARGIEDTSRSVLSIGYLMGEDLVIGGRRCCIRPDSGW